MAVYYHDNEYNRYLKSGLKASKVYLGYSDADMRMIKRANVKTPDGIATYLGMNVKKGLWKLGIGSRIRDKNVKGLKRHKSASLSKKEFDKRWTGVRKRKRRM